MSAAELSIRRAALGDADAIAEVHTTCWQVAYRGLIPAEMLAHVTLERHRGEWQRYLHRPQPSADRVWVASRLGRLLGFAYTAPSRDPDCDAQRIAELVALYVHPRQWRQGAGRALTLGCLDDLSRRGYDALTLWVLSENLRAQRFYRELDIRPDGTTEQRMFGGALLTLERYRIELPGGHVAPGSGPGGAVLG